ncbi:hypothetical protein BDF21DRAFT_432864 [Thamnidium elegans]|nr:hypothetical protein BDF21DRAFT_432864 [Thamnidium elegans]
MIETTKTEKLQNLIERKRPSRRKNSISGSSFSSISAKSQHPNRFSAYAPGIEEQLNSLVIENNEDQEDVAELLQQDFEQPNIETEYYQPSIPFRDSINYSSLGSLAHISHSSDITDTESHQVSPSISSYRIKERNNVPQDFSSFPSLFEEKPTIIGKHPNYYITSPSRIRNYLELPDEFILKTMKLPYPYRTKEPISQRLDCIDSNDLLQTDFNMKHPPQLEGSKRSNNRNRSVSPRPSFRHIKTLERHSVALGQVDRLLENNKDRPSADSLSVEPISNNELIESRNDIYKQYRPMSLSSSRAVQDILKWIPDQDTVWQDSRVSDSVQMVEIPNSSTNSRRKRPLHPLDHSL